MHKRVLIVVALVVFVLPLRSVWAWNDTGHKAAAWICWQQLQPEVQAKVSALLEKHPQYASVLKPGDSADQRQIQVQVFLKAATWPDIVRRGEANRRYHHGEWHYIDIPFVVGPLPDSVAAPEPPPVDWKPGTDPANALQALAKCIADIKDPATSDEQKAISLAWIEHLVADLHQPLHAASLFSRDYPQGDKGGNLVMVNVAGKITNLHAFWDDILGRYESFELIKQIADKSVELSPRAALADQLKPAESKAWALESFEIAKTVVYKNGKIESVTRDKLSADKSIQIPPQPQEYFDSSRELARRRIALSGYRLAEVLNGLFSTPTTAP